MKTNPHSDLVNQVLLAIGSLPNFRVWKNSTGTARTMAGNIISFGLKGSPDIIGITHSGKFLGLECKTGKAVQSKEQKNFEAMIKKFNGLYFVCHSVQEALDFLIAATKDS